VGKDNRGQQRHKVMSPAKIETEGRGGEGVLHDISFDGACIGVGFEAPLNAKVKISVEGFGELTGRVVRRKKRLGIRFDTAPAEAGAHEENILRLIKTASSRKLVMVVEDSATQTVTLRAILEEEGFKVLCLASAEDAMSLLRSTMPDIMIVDYRLPGINGDELCRRLRMNINTQGIPVLMLTSNTEDGSEVRGLESGADDYVSKNEDHEILLLRIHSLLIRGHKENLLMDLYAPLFHRPRVLVIDDSPTFLERLKDDLSDDEYTVEVTTSPRKGLSLAKKGAFDCVLIDMVMPDIERGIMARRLVEDRKNSGHSYVIIALSAFEEKGNVAQALEAGIDDFVGKSAGIDVLKARIKSSLRQMFLRHQRQEIIHELHRHKDELEQAVEERTKALRQEIVERKRMEAELRLAKKEAEAASNAKSHFLANMSHELRTPLTAIIGFSEAIKTSMSGTVTTWDPEKYMDYIDHIFTSGHHLLTIINDVLDISRIEGGKVDLEKSHVDIGELLEKSWDFFGVEAGKKRIMWRMDVPNDVAPVYVDRRLISQTLLNLFSNAVKFSPDDGTITVTVAEQAGGGISITVSDTGIGIAKKDLLRVLEPFGQVETAFTKNYKGSGLGLPLAKSFMELHGGSLDLRSELGKGTSVILSLPSG